ncbi:antizyme inhibitor 2-like [Cimex lectularius]|uniref:ornithine decarboxylase n=1 Tax=Cimex lectularius TaxID=79782 RepID=A0A8I6SBK1_CIMLE|nr:antizyme inhibitor 2-like [Cimex lectularius]XP_014260446.1 antizyme inhibitor 2-like [Cimex lectularius]
MKTECGINIIKSNSEIRDYMTHVIQKQDDSFYILNLTTLETKYKEWRSNLPTVTPFYAVKCNHSIMVIKTLAALGCNFDCASKSEIKKVLSVGVSPDRIIYANPAKMLSHLDYAAKHGVRMMTYDNASEIDKIKEHYPLAHMVLRIRADALDVSVPLGTKFGCDPELGLDLIMAAINKGLKVIGISFHVGSGCREVGAYARAIHIACNLIKKAKENNVSLSLLDIGGGFSGNDSLQFSEMSILINEALHEEREVLKGIRVIAEPGRFFVWSAYTLLTSINGMKEEGSKIQYYINDGIYSSFNCKPTENIIKYPTPFKRVQQGPLKNCCIWGQTNRQLDLVSSHCLLPEMNVGDWLMFTEMGAYSIPLSMNFNGYPIPNEHYFVTKETWSSIGDFFRNLEKQKTKEKNNAI